MIKNFFTKSRWLVTIILLLSLSVGQMWATTTYKLTQVSSVSAGNKYVFVRDGHAFGSTVSSKALQTVSSYSTTGLAGTEAYVWTLETATGGFYMKNVSLASNQYLNNASKTDMSFGSASSIWTFSFSSNVATIQNSSNSDRFLGDAGKDSPNHTYRAYATSNLSDYQHSITVYRLDEEAVSCSNYSFHYGATRGTKSITDQTVECFSRVGSTDEYQVTGFTIPATSQSYFVGYTNYWYDDGMGTGSCSPKKPGSSLNYFYYLPITHLQAGCDGKTGAGLPHAYEGAYGTIRIYQNSCDANLYAGFKPQGYQMRVGSGDDWENVELTVDPSDETVWTSAVMDVDATMKEKKYYVNIWTGSAYSSSDDGVSINNWTNGDNKITSMRHKTNSGDNWADGVAAGSRGFFRTWVNNCANNGYMHFVPTHRVVFYANWPTGAGTDQYSVDVSVEESNASIALASDPTAPTGYTFDGWYDAASGGTKITTARSISAGATADIELYAHWNETLHDVTVEYKCGSTSLQDNTTIEGVGIATTGTTTAPASFTGYTWSTWSSMPSGVTTSTTPLTTRTIVINATADDKTITANYTANEYNITYKDQGNLSYSGAVTAGVPTGAPTTHTYGSATALVNGSKTGYDFGGWFTDKECTVSAGSSIGATAITADITLYAKWTLHTYTISSTLNNCSSDPSIPSSYTYTGASAGLNYTLTANSGYALPASVTVSGVTYTWNQATGVLALTGTISSDVSITVTALPQVTWMAGGSVFNTQSGTAGTALSNPGTPSNSTYCDGIKVFVGWSASTINGTTDTKPADLFSSAAATKKTIPAGGTTYYAVFATRSGTNPTSITTFATGTYYLIDKCGDKYYAMSGSTPSGITAVDVTSYVTVKSTTITVDPLTFTDDMEYVITGTTSAAHITQSETAIYNTSGTSFNSNSGSDWAVTESSDKFEFSGNSRCILYQSSSNVFKNYATSNLGNSGYSSGYLFIVPIATYTGYATTCAECTTAATVGAANLKGDFSLSSVGVTCPTSGTSVGTNCSWLDYGFVWSPSSNTTPTIGGTNCIKVQTGTTGSSNTWDDDLESTFVVGNTYYYRAYGKNGKAESDFVYGTVNSFIPRSVTFNLNGHGESAPSTQYVPDGGKAADPSYSEAVAGWTFGGWYDNSSCTGDAWVFGTNTVSGNNVILYAKWTEKPKYTVTLDAGNGTIGTAGWTNTSGSVYTKTQDNGDASITLPTPTCNCSGWVFQGWSTTSKSNAASFTPDKADGASFVPANDVTYYAVYRQSTAGGTTYSKITSAGDLTTGNYIIISSSSYAMKNVVHSGGTYMDESSYGTFSASGSSIETSASEYIWTIIKFGSQVVIKNGTDFLGINDDNNICLTTTPHFFTYTYNTTNSRWEFTSATKTTYQLVYSTYFKMLTSQNTAIYLYKQGAGLTGNYYTNPTCSDLSITGVVDPAEGGSVTMSATSAKSGEKVYAYYTPDEDYNFTDWSISGTGSTLSSTSAQFTEITVGTANTTVTANFAAKDWKTVTWKANGEALTGGDLGSASVKVENGHDITAMPPTPSSCDGTSTDFIGWVAESDIWSGKTDDVSGVTIYEKIADFPTVTGNVVYHAVWAHQIGTPIAEIEDNSFTSTDENGSYCNAPFSLKAAGKYLQKQSIWTSSQMQNVTVKIRVFHVANNTAATLRVSLINSDGDEVVGSDLTAGVTGNNISDGGYTDWVELIPTSAVTGYKVSMKTPATFGTAISKVAREVVGSGAEAYLVKCCDAPGLEFETYEQEVIREDLKGVKSTHKVIELPYTTSSGGTVTAEVKRLGSTYGSRSTALAGYDCTAHTSISVDEENNKVVLEVWSVNDPATSGQWTYRVKVMQAATDALAGNYCAAEDYCFVDVVLRDKFVDQVNGNATINKDGKGTTLNTPAEGDMDVDKNDDCHSTTRRLLGWIKETDLQTIYGTPRETGALDDASAYEANKSMVVAPGNSFTTSGVTWYAVWGIDNTPEP